MRGRFAQREMGCWPEHGVAGHPYQFLLCSRSFWEFFLISLREGKLEGRRRKRRTGGKERRGGREEEGKKGGAGGEG